MTDTLHLFVDLAVEDARRGEAFALVDHGTAIARECEAEGLLYRDLTPEQEAMREQIAEWRRAGLA